MNRFSRIRVRCLFLAGSISLLPVSGCSHTDSGLVGGGIIGSLVGALAAGPRHRGAGALVGGIAGAGVGALAGASQDNHERKVAAREAALRQPALQIQDVIDLTANGMSDEVIINQIRASGAIYHLTANDLLALQRGGVRETVIREMQASACRPVRRVYTAIPVAEPIYIVPPPPPPPVGFGVGVSIRR